jgi:hypothetical protein
MGGNAKKTDEANGSGSETMPKFCYEVPEGYVTCEGQPVKCFIAYYGKEENDQFVNRGNIGYVLFIENPSTGIPINGGRIVIKHQYDELNFYASNNHYMYVKWLENATGKKYSGIGTTLCQAAIENSRVRGYDGVLFLEACYASPPFYKKIGFNVIWSGDDIGWNERLDSLNKEKQQYTNARSLDMAIFSKDLENEPWKSRLQHPILPTTLKVNSVPQLSQNIMPEKQAKPTEGTPQTSCPPDVPKPAVPPIAISVDGTPQLSQSIVPKKQAKPTEETPQTSCPSDVPKPAMQPKATSSVINGVTTFQGHTASIELNRERNSFILFSKC